MSGPDISQVVPPQPMPDVSTPAPVPVLAGSPGSPQAAGAANRPPTPSPILLQLIRGLTHPQMVAPAPGEEARPVSRLATFENFLGNFVNALGQGMAAAHGPGAFGKGFGAAVTAPYQQDLQRFQLDQQAQANQANIQREQAQAQLTQAQAQPTFVPELGMTLPAGSIPTIYKGYPAAQAGAQSRVEAAGIAGQVKLLTTAMTNPSLPLDPALAQAAGHPEWANKPIGKAQLAALTSEINTKTKLVGTTRTGVQIREDADGNLLQIPVSSTSRPNLPANGAPSASGTPSGFPKAGTGEPRVIAQGKVPQMAFGTDSEGRQVAGTPSELKKAGVTNQTPLPASEVAKVNTARQLTAPGGLFDLAEKDLAKFKPGELEALAPRWNEFLAGKIGTADPRYIALRTHVNGLLGTAMMQAHVGARGGEQMMEHFEDIANAGKMSKDTLAAALNAEKQYVQEKAMRPTQRSGKSGNTVLDPLGIR